MFMVGPNRSNQKSSHSVQCTWAMHKVKQNHASASLDSLQATTSGLLQDFLSVFAASLTSPTGDLNKAYTQSQATYAQKISPSSSRDFMNTPVDAFLGVLQDLLLGVLKVVNRFADGALNVVADLIGTLQSILTTPIHIPVSSSLWQRVTGQTLSLQGIAVFVLSIPVVILYRVIERVNVPSTLESGTLNRVIGVASAITAMFNGLLQTISDAFAANTDEDTPVLSRLQQAGARCRLCWPSYR